jgi:hypothetical protein
MATTGEGTEDVVEPGVPCEWERPGVCTSQYRLCPGVGKKRAGTNLAESGVRPVTVRGRLCGVFVNDCEGTTDMLKVKSMSRCGGSRDGIGCCHSPTLLIVMAASWIAAGHLVQPR